jgi:hypothetical protein
MYIRLGRGRIVLAKTFGTMSVSDMSNEESFLISFLTIKDGHFSPVPLWELLQRSDLRNITGKL